jgi:hypothetical protein
MAAFLPKLAEPLSEDDPFPLNSDGHRALNLLLFRLAGFTLLGKGARRCTMPDPDITERIRTIFLHEEAYVSISEATVLFGWSRRRMKEAIDAGEIETIVTCLGKVMVREELIATAVDLWSLETIEEALGPDASRVLPEAIRTCELAARLPRYQVAMLEYFGRQRQTNVSDVLARELDDFASAHFEELRSAIPGFAEAFEWPRQDETRRPC